MSILDDIIATLEHHPTSTPSTTLLFKTSPQKPTLEKGILYGYAAVWKDVDGLDYIDDYGDATCSGSWNETIAAAKAEMKNTGRAYLMPHLFNHDKHSPIGGVTHLAEDSKGIVYESKVALNTAKGREVYELAKEGVLGTSYGYEPVVTEKGTHPKTGKPVRMLRKIAARELSSVVFPANPYSVSYAKSRYTTHASRIDELASKMGASFDELERQLHMMHSAFPNFDWMHNAYPSEIGVDIADLLIEIQKQVK